jgi:adenylate cyclase
MSEEKEFKAEELGALIGTYAANRSALDLLRPWKIISHNNIYIIYLSVLLFAVYAFARHGFNWIALSTSLIASVPIGFVIAFFETQSQEFRRRHRRTRFWLYLMRRTFRLVIWFMALFAIIMIIVNWLKINTYETIFPHSLYDFFATNKLFEFLALALCVSLISNFLDDLYRKLGRDAIYNLVLGKYHQVKQEERLFLFIDLNNSTDIAEEMGEMEFSHFLQDYFYDISEPIARYFGRVYQYVGDEVVVTWPLKKGLRYAVCVRCFFAIQKQINRYKDQYIKRFGRVPEFKASLHGGSVVVSEVGKYKSEIAYHGDVLNTTARMLSSCHDLNSEFVISDYVADKVTLPNYLSLETLGTFQLKGKQQEVEIHSVILSSTGGAVKKRRLFSNMLMRKKNVAVKS